jgi:enamine deaminase RidA (YjgF/YER057c/UK114 family)
MDTAMPSDYDAKLAGLGFTLSPVELNSGRFMRAVRTGDLIYTAGAVSSFGGTEIKGQVGGELTVGQGYAAARLATVSALAAVKSLAGGLEHVAQVVKVLGMVNVAPGFTQTPDVIHGCSDLLLAVFGAAGRHARSAVGVVLPYNYAVEIELIVELR